MRYLLICICAAFLVLLSAEAAIYTVDPYGTGDFPTIQAAIDAAEHGDIIELTVGTFAGNGNRDIDFLGKAITVRSQTGNPVTCIIDCEGSGGSPHRGFRFHLAEGPNSVIESITIANGHVVGDGATGRGGGIHCQEGTAPTFRGLILWENFAENAGGGIAVYYADASISGCTFVANSSTYGGGFNCHVGEATVSNCTFVENAAEYGGGVRSSRSDVYFQNTIIAYGTWGSAVRCDNDGSAHLSCCDLYANAGGDYTGCIDWQHGINGNISLDPLFCGVPVGNYGLHEGSPCGPFSPPNEECDLIGAWPVGCEGYEPQTYTVRPDGTGDFPTIQAAIDVSWIGDTVLLVDGVFRGDGNRDLQLTWRPIIVKSESGIPEQCVIDCEGEEDHPHRGFNLLNGTGSATRLEGFTIANGYVGEHGGGVQCADTYVRFSNCRFENCTALRGGGLSCYRASPDLEGCLFLRNQALEGAAAYLNNESAPEITSCEFTANLALWGRGGAIFSIDASPVLSGCTVDSNMAPLGGGFYASGGEPHLANCTFIANVADQGSGLWCEDNYLLVQNTILAYGLCGEAVYCEDDYSAALECCDVYGNEGGDWVDCISWMEDILGNISESPRFCGSAGDHPYELLDTSPCAPFTPPNEECDLIGAWGVGCALTDAVSEEEGYRHPLLTPGYPNPFTQSAELGFVLPRSMEGTNASLSVFDASGRLVRTLVDGPQRAGIHRIVWDGTDNQNRRVDTGIYFLKLDADGHKLVRRLTVVR